MLKHGVVNLEHVLSESLIGHGSRESFEPLCHLRHGEPVVLLSPPPIVRQGLDQQLLPVLPHLVPQDRRLKVWVPHLGFAAWVWQATTSGKQMIRWGLGGDPKRGKVDLTAAGLDNLVGRWHEPTEGPVACNLQSGQIVHAAVPAAGSRRVRVWVPRLNVACWVWQASNEGFPLIKWFGRRDVIGEIELRTMSIVQLTEDVSAGASAQPLLSKGDFALRCAGPGCLLLPPGSNCNPVTASEACISDCFPPLQLSVAHSRDVLPVPLLRRANGALDAFAAQADGRGKEFDALLGRAAQQRDEVWRDLLDPDLCLCDPMAAVGLESGPLEWQTAEVDVDAAGVARWASWLNHVDEHRHGELLSALAELFGASLPCLEEVCSRSFCSSRLQVICRATDLVLMHGTQQFYHVSEWHTDGNQEECILATAICYLDVGANLSGGSVEFAGYADAWLDDACATEVLQPCQGSVVAFDNFALRHRVNLLSGHGRRRLVAFHLVDPENRQRPSAAALPRQWHLQQVWDIQDALAPLKSLPAGRIAIRRIAEFAAGGQCAEELLLSRLAERQKRLQPDPSSGFLPGMGRIRRGTGSNPRRPARRRR